MLLVEMEHKGGGARARERAVGREGLDFCVTERVWTNEMSSDFVDE